MPIANLLVTVAIGYLAAVLFYFARGLSRGPRTAIFGLLGTIVLITGLQLVTEHISLRFTVAAILPISFWHMWDLHVDPARRTRLTLKSYMVFLLDYAWSVARVDQGYGTDLPLKRRALDAARSVTGLVLVSAIVVVIFQIDWIPYPFWAEHAAKSTGLAGLTVWAFQANTALWRLAGAPAAWFTTRSVLRARSPADFWRRWNRPMHRWLYEDVFRPAGGRGRPVLATLGTFAVSALLHEYLFAIWLQRATGYPTVFFGVHGLATVLTRRWKPTGPRTLLAGVGTFAFNTLSTVLLFVPVNDRVAFYANAIPEWVPKW